MVKEADEIANFTNTKAIHEDKVSVHPRVEIRNRSGKLAVRAECHQKRNANELGKCKNGVVSHRTVVTKLRIIWPNPTATPRGPNFPRQPTLSVEIKVNGGPRNFEITANNTSSAKAARCVPVRNFFFQFI